jgi:hypothetical protein
MRCSSARSLPAALIVAALLAAAPARAGEPAEDAARAAYGRAAAAYDRGDYAAAAGDFARADELVPNPVTLETALRAALKADLVALGMELADRAALRGAAGSLAERVEEAKKAFAGRAGRVVVRCPTTCKVTLDGAGAPADTPRWVTAGEHEVTIDAGGAVEKRRVRAEPGQLTEVAAAAPPRVEAPIAPAAPPRVEAPIAPAAPPRVEAPIAPAARAGISPGWLGLGVGLTAVAGGLAIGFGVDTARKHDAFTAAPTLEAQSAGQEAQLRTNVLAGVAGALGVATAAIGVFAVEWRATPAARGTALRLGLAGAGLAASGRFQGP